MIFDKKVYTSSGPLHSFFKRLSVLTLKIRKLETFRDESFLIYPYVNRVISEDEFFKLKASCHVDAFSRKEKLTILDVSLCNNCKDCFEFDFIDTDNLKVEKLTRNLLNIGK